MFWQLRWKTFWWPKNVIPSVNNLMSNLFYSLILSRFFFIHLNKNWIKAKGDLRRFANGEPDFKKLLCFYSNLKKKNSHKIESKENQSISKLKFG